MFGVKEQVESTARKAALFTAGGMLCAVGLAFLTVAAWLVLDEMFDTYVAAVVLGCAYLGVGLITMSRGVDRKDHKSSSTQTHESSSSEKLSPLQEVAVSFVKGVESGLATKPPHKPS